MLKTTWSGHSTTLSKPNADRIPTVLCIDDDPEITRIIEARLSTYEVKVICSFTGMQGIWQAIQSKPDLIISDVRMPQGDGTYLLDCIRQNQATSHIPVIVLSGMRDRDLANQMKLRGAASFLHKPIHYQDLIHEISRHIELVEKPFPFSEE